MKFSQVNFMCENSFQCLSDNFVGALKSQRIALIRGVISDSGGRWVPVLEDMFRSCSENVFTGSSAELKSLYKAIDTRRRWGGVTQEVGRRLLLLLQLLQHLADTGAGEQQSIHIIHNH